MTLSDLWHGSQGQDISEVEYRKKTARLKDKVTIAQEETIPNIWNGTMFGDLDWPLNVSCSLSASAELLVMFWKLNFRPLQWSVWTISSTKSCNHYVVCVHTQLHYFHFILYHLNLLIAHYRQKTVGAWAKTGELQPQPHWKLQSGDMAAKSPEGEQSAVCSVHSNFVDIHLDYMVCDWQANCFRNIDDEVGRKPGCRRQPVDHAFCTPDLLRYKWGI